DLAGIPRWRDIGIGAHEDSERLAKGRHMPLRIGPRNMPIEDPLLAFSLTEEKRQRRCDEAVGRRGHQSAETRAAHDLMQDLAVVFAESRRKIHGGILDVATVLTSKVDRAKSPVPENLFSPPRDCLASFGGDNLAPSVQLLGELNEHAG